MRESITSLAREINIRLRHCQVNKPSHPPIPCFKAGVLEITATQLIEEQVWEIVKKLIKLPSPYRLIMTDSRPELEEGGSFNVILKTSSKTGVPGWFSQLSV